MTSFIFPYYFPKQQLRIVQSVKEKKKVKFTRALKASKS